MDQVNSCVIMWLAKDGIKIIVNSISKNLATLMPIPRYNSTFHKVQNFFHYSSIQVMTSTYSYFSFLKISNPVRILSIGSNPFPAAPPNSAVNCFIFSAAATSSPPFSLQSIEKKMGKILLNKYAEFRTPRATHWRVIFVLNGTH